MSIVDPAQAERPLILTVDVGSSSIRALLFDRQGREVAGSVARIVHAFSTVGDGGVEDDPAVVVAYIEQCIDDTLAQSSAVVEQIGAVAFDTYVSNVCGINMDGQPLTPLYLYADTRSDADAAALRQECDEPEVLDRTGCPLRASYLPAQLRWLRRTQPDTFERVSRWITVGEYALLRFFDTTHVSVSVAAWSGLLNRHTLAWDEPLLHMLGLSAESFSPLVNSDQALTGLNQRYADRWPALAQVPWFPAIGDGAAANLGSGCVTPDRVALTVGTTGALRVVSPTVATVPQGLWCYCVDQQRALLGGATSEGGNVFAWLNAVLQLGSPDEIEQALQERTPDGHGLTVLPFVAGERSPGWGGDLGASIVGMRLRTTPMDMLRASLEGIAYRFALITRLLTPVLPREQIFVANGGALLSSPAWMQIMADVLGQPVYASNEGEASSRGAALLALEYLGEITAMEDLPLDYSDVYEPDSRHRQRYDEAIERQQALYERLSG